MAEPKEKDYTGEGRIIIGNEVPTEKEMKGIKRALMPTGTQITSTEEETEKKAKEYNDSLGGGVSYTGGPDSEEAKKALAKAGSSADKISGAGWGAQQVAKKTAEAMKNESGKIDWKNNLSLTRKAYSLATTMFNGNSIEEKEIAEAKLDEMGVTPDDFEYLLKAGRKMAAFAGEPLALTGGTAQNYARSSMGLNPAMLGVMSLEEANLGASKNSALNRSTSDRDEALNYLNETIRPQLKEISTDIDINQAYIAAAGQAVSFLAGAFAGDATMGAIASTASASVSSKMMLQEKKELIARNDMYYKEYMAGMKDFSKSAQAVWLEWMGNRSATDDKYISELNTLYKNKMEDEMSRKRLALDDKKARVDALYKSGQLGVDGYKVAMDALDKQANAYTKIAGAFTDNEKLNQKTQFFNAGINSRAIAEVNKQWSTVLKPVDPNTLGVFSNLGSSYARLNALSMQDKNMTLTALSDFKASPFDAYMLENESFKAIDNYVSLINDGYMLDPKYTRGADSDMFQTIMSELDKTDINSSKEVLSKLGKYLIKGEKNLYKANATAIFYAQQVSSIVKDTQKQSSSNKQSLEVATSFVKEYGKANPGQRKNLKLNFNTYSPEVQEIIRGMIPDIDKGEE